MMKMLKCLDKKIKFQIVVIFVLILVLNILTVPTSDDFPYSMSNGFLDIFKLEYIQYMTWGGRSVAHILARFFLTLPKIIFNIANSAMFCYLVHLVYRHAKGNKKEDVPIAYTMIACLIFVGAPTFGQTVLWETGACNYLWTTVIILHFLLKYRLNETSENSNSFKIMSMFGLGILAGWSNENTGGACVLLVCMFIIFKWIVKKEKPTAWMISGFIGSVVGFLFMVLAPGNAIRAIEFQQTGSLMYTLVHDLTSTIDVLRKGFTLPFVLIALFGVTAWISDKNKDDLWLTGIYVFAGVAAVGAIILSPVPVVWDRSMFGAFIFIVIAVFINIMSLDMNEFIKQCITYTVAIILLIQGSLCFGQASLDLFYTMKQYKQRENYIQDQKTLGNNNPVVFQLFQEFVTPYNPLYGLNDITPYSSFWLNASIADTYDLQSIQSTPLRVWEIVYKNGDPLLMNIQELEEYVSAISNNNNLITFINCSDLNANYIEYTNSLKILGIDVGKYKNFVAVIEGGTIINKEFGDRGVDLFGQFNDKEYYLASYSKGHLSDILINDIEYTNNNDGINFVVFDKEKYRVVDVVTFNTDNGTKGIRYQEGD